MCRSDYHDQDKIHKYLKLPRKDFADDEEDDFDDKLMVNLMTSVIREMISNNTDKDTEVCQDISEEEKENVDDLVQELMNMRDYIYKVWSQVFFSLYSWYTELRMRAHRFA